MNRARTVFLLLLLNFVALHAQDSKEVLKGNADKAQGMFDGGFRKSAAQGPDVDDTALDLVSVEVQPEYPGGYEARMNDLRDAFSLTEEDTTCIRQKVYVEFVVDTAGNVTRSKVLRSSCPTYDQEALRMVQAMKRWKPAMHKGRAVACRMVLPVIFRFN